MEIEKRCVGRTTLEVTALGLGGATLGGVAPVTKPEAQAIVERAYQAGVRYFDTAPQYGYGKSEPCASPVPGNVYLADAVSFI